MSDAYGAIVVGFSNDFSGDKVAIAATLPSNHVPSNVLSTYGTYETTALKTRFHSAYQKLCLAMFASHEQ